ncbi:hypothetical protein P152DRAFT_471996 [Eremomyces bilateralis CBS 781.70]|uniref:Proteasome maturation factor UMP1 n=1 Tax=Eremomyces bilateralis CBS 781.70 TaxID=1392243 RepID=A0A6G1G8G4_9PEZI|nr:uncharacterized protein P152DRAFT_471996 [Eremomyces bilateralis CBS 781.70]KAF1814216.1 hypothetical protein P152DRAFT_471996 [Eremomyces bilateralis CBS 781.70]
MFGGVVVKWGRSGSLRFIPSSSNATQTPNHPSAPSAPGVPDTLRGHLDLTATLTPSSTSSKPAATATPTPITSHPLEARLMQWRATQDALKMETLRRVYGIAEPVKRGMELQIVGAGEWAPAMVGGTAAVHREVLEGREMDVAWEDVFVGNETREVPDFHSEMEGNFKMNW